MLHIASIKHFKIVAIFLFFAFSCAFSFAIEIPSAGRILQEIKPNTVEFPPKSQEHPLLKGVQAAKPISDRSLFFTLRHIQINGANPIMAPQLPLLFNDLIGQEIDMAGLEAVTAKITAFYRQAGYLLAHAILPAQSIQNGVVHITILEGSYGAIVVNSNGLIKPTSLPLGAILIGDPVMRLPLERSLLLLSDVAGITANSTLQPGSKVGATDLVIDLHPGPSSNTHAELDNYGSESTGIYRLAGSVWVHNPASLGDQINLHLLSTGRGLNYGRMQYQMPIGNNGIKIGVAASELRYRLIDQFSILGASGNARIYSGFASYPLVRTRNQNVSMQIGLDDKHTQDEIASVLINTKKNVRNMNLSVSADTRSDDAITALNVGFTFGNLDINSPATLEVDQLSTRSNGRFNKMNVNLIHLQNISINSSVYASYTAQWASKNLDSSEKMILGGAQAVRAYNSGAVSADQVQLLSVELRHHIAPGWQVVGFMDTAQARINRELWAHANSDNQRNLSGAGLGINWAVNNMIQCRGVYAYKIGNIANNLDRDHRGRAWLQMTINY